MAGKQESGQDGGFWGPKKKPPARRWRRRVLISLGCLLGVLVLVAALAPTVAGWIAPGIVEGALAGSIRGSAKVDRVSLSWFGGQAVGPVTIRDDQGVEIARVEAQLSRSLLGLIGGLDLGEARVRGRATVVREADGTLNLQQVFGGGATSGPATGGSGGGSGGTRVPTSLVARLLVDSLQVTYLDRTPGAGSAVRLENVKGRGEFAVGRPLTLDLSADAVFGRDEQSLSPGGSILVAVRVDGLATASGLVRPQEATFEATVEGQRLAAGLADALAGTGSGLTGALGPTVAFVAKASGSMHDASASLDVRSDGVTADVGVRYAQEQGGAVITASRPGTLRVRTAGFVPLVPALAEALREQREEVSIEQWPEVTATLEQLRLRLPAPGADPDLRKSGVALSVRTSEVSGRVRVPGQPGMSEFRVLPLTLAVAAPDLAGSIGVKMDTAAKLRGQPAGSLVVDLSAAGVLDDRGRVRTGPPRAVSGSVFLTQLATAIAQPFVEAAGLDLASDVGPELDVELRTMARAEAGAAGPPPTDVTVVIDSENLRASMGAQLREGVIRSTGNGLSVRMASAGPLAERLLAGAGLTVESGGTVALSVPEFSLDTARLVAGDLRGAAATVRVAAGPASGRVVLRPGEAAQAWELAPLGVQIDAKNLAEGVRLAAGTNLKLDGQLAGVLDANVAAAGFLDEAGKFVGGVPKSLDASASIRGISTAVAQPWVAAAGLNLPQDIGPRVDIGLGAVTRAGAGSGPPVADVDLTVTSANVVAAAALTLDDRGIRGRDAAEKAGVEVNVRQAGAIAGRLAADRGARITPEGYLKVAVTGIDIPLTEGAARLDRAAARASVGLGGFGIEIPRTGGDAGAPAGAEQIRVGRLDVIAALAPGEPARLIMDSTLTHGSGPFVARADLLLAGLFGPAGSVSPQSLRPTGSLELRDVPTALSRLAPGAAEWAGLIQDAVGRTITVTLESAKSPVGDQLDLRATIASDGVSTRAVAALAPDRLDVGRFDVNANITPELASGVLARFQPDLKPRPRLAAPAAVTASLNPVRVPLDPGFVPALARAGELSLRVKLDGRAIVQGLSMPDAEGKPRDLGPIGLEGLELVAKAPAPSLVQGGRAEQPASVTVTGRVIGAGGERHGDLNAAARVMLTAGAPAGPIETTLTLTDASTQRLDEILGKAGMVSGALGDRATVDAQVTLVTPQERKPEGPAYERLTAQASVTSPRLRTSRPLKATLTPEIVSLDAPLVATWSMEPAWATTWVLGQELGVRDRPPVMRFAAPAEVTLSVYRLRLPMGDAPLKPGVFSLDAGADAPALVLAAADGTPARFESFKLRAQGGGEGQAPGTIGFSLRMEEGAGGTGSGVQFGGGVYQVSDAEGRLTTDRAMITARGGAERFPTALVDAMARQKGLLVEALGPTITLDVQAEGLSKSGGNLTASAMSARASVKLRGTVRDGAFVAAETVQADLLEITPALGARLVEGLPLVGTFEKRRQDGPAAITVNGLTVPVDGQMSRLNGDFTLALGTVRFQTSPVFGALLKVTGQRDAGMLGRRVEPFKATIRDGVMKYERYTLPLGEFTVATRGEVDFVKRTMDVVTYLPLGALTDEAAGVFNTGLGRTLGGAVPMLERATMVPWRTKGPLGSATTSPDVGLFVKEFGQNLLNPGGLLDPIFRPRGGGG